jgi:hypothetical protein
MSIAITLCLCGGLALTLALVVAVHHKVDALPPRIWSIAKQERAQDAGAAVTALQEATAARVGPIVVSIRAYEEQIAATFRAQVADAQMRARIAERQSSEAGVALRAASELVREARVLRDDLARLLLAGVIPGGARSVAPAERRTAPLLPPAPCAPDADSEDSGAWLHEARPSDADGDHTRVGRLPSPEQLEKKEAP